MGSLPDYRNLRGAGDGRARTFGTLPVNREVLLMNVARSQGVWTFAEEVPAEFNSTARLVRWIDVHGTEHSTCWWETSVFGPEQSTAVKAGRWLALAQWPWSREQVNYAEFRRGSKKEASRRPVVPEGKFTRDSELMAWLASLGNDHWEKGNRIVARVSQPSQLQLGGKSVDRHHGLFVFGLCDEPCDSIVEELVAGEEAQDLVRQLRTDQLRFWMKKPEVPLEQLPKAYPETKSMADSLMMLALRLAVAGPEKHSEKWFGRPVADLASLIFRNLVNLYNRREHARRDPEAPQDDDW